MAVLSMEEFMENTIHCDRYHIRISTIVCEKKQTTDRAACIGCELATQLKRAPYTGANRRRGDCSGCDKKDIAFHSYQKETNRGLCRACYERVGTIQ